MSLKCKKVAVKNIYIPGLIYWTRENIGIMERILDVIPQIFVRKTVVSISIIETCKESIYI